MLNQPKPSTSEKKVDKGKGKVVTLNPEKKVDKGKGKVVTLNPEKKGRW